jgi:hypothetical protein
MTHSWEYIHLPESSKEGSGSRRAVSPMMVMVMANYKI